MKEKNFTVKSENGNTLNINVRFDDSKITRNLIYKNKEYEIEKYPQKLNEKEYYTLTEFAQCQFNKNNNLSKNTKTWIPCCRKEIKSAIKEMQEEIINNNELVYVSKVPSGLFVSYDFETTLTEYSDLEKYEKRGQGYLIPAKDLMIKKINNFKDKIITCPSCEFKYSFSESELFNEGHCPKCGF